jgi:hypothetical protein
VTLEEAARLAGGFRWAEIRLFEVLGGWVASTPEADIKLIFDRHSHHHAWRAAQWWDRLPVLAGVDREDLTKPPNPPTEQAYAGLSELESTPARLAAAYRFALPRLAAAYRNYQDAANPASDGSGLRTVRLVGSDLETDWRDGELALQRSLTGPGPVEEAARTVARLEQMVVQLP